MFFNRISEKPEIDDLEDKIDLLLPANLNEFSNNVVAYIAGFVAKIVQKKIKCSLCCEALLSLEVDEYNNHLQLINKKCRGGF